MGLPAKAMTIGLFGRWDQQRTERLTITGEQARYILNNHNPRNRRLNPVHVNRLARTLQDGHWKYNGETAIFDCNGHCKDGQHRFAACAQTDIPIDILVVFGVDPDVFDTIGRCKPRSLKDDLGLDGEVCLINIAATLRLIYSYVSGERSQAVTATEADSITLREYLRLHPEIRESSQAATNMAKKSGGYVPMTPRVTGAAHFLFGEKCNVTRDQFFESLRHGDGLMTGNPILSLRNRIFMDVSKSNGRVQRTENAFMQFNLIIRTWNAVRQHRTLTKLQVPYHVLKDRKVPDPLPEIL